MYHKSVNCFVDIGKEDIDSPKLEDIEANGNSRMRKL